ncbi:MAG: NAD(P)-dependent oxidoreductase [Bacteroidia bacterium]
MNEKKVFITGVTGFVGRHLAEYFHKQGFTVYGLLRDAGKLQEAEIPFVKAVQGDLTHIPDEALKDITYFVHVAGVISARHKEKYYEVNATGTRHLVEQIVRICPDFKRFLLISSLAAAGPALERPRSVQDSEEPVSHYGKSKLAGEKEVESVIKRFTIIRPPVLFGPYDRGMLMPFQVAAKYGIAPIVGNGRSKMDFLYIDDFVKACYDALLSPAAEGKKYFLGENSFNWIDFWKMMNTASGKKLRVICIPQVIVKGLGLFNDLTKSSMLNSDKAKELISPNWTSTSTEAQRDFNFRLQEDTQTALNSTYQWYKSKGWL